MKIEFNFEIGNPVWFIHNNKACNSIVQGVKIEVSPKTPDKVEITLLCNNEPGQIANVKVDLAGAYHSKEKLIEAL